jgi:hypothetical protein
VHPLSGCQVDHYCSTIPAHPLIHDLGESNVLNIQCYVFKLKI